MQQHVGIVLAVAAAVLAGDASAEPAATTARWVWVFGWNLGRTQDVAEVRNVLEKAARAGANGAVISAGLDTLCKKTPEQWERIEAVQRDCDRLGLEFIPAIFSVGYGGGILSHDRHLAEGLPVRDALMVARGGEARFESDLPVEVRNGAFEVRRGHTFPEYRFQDAPGVTSFADTETRHGGAAALRMENFTANRHGHGRIMQEIRVRPRRCYRVSAWVKTEDLQPADAFRIQVLAGSRSLAPREFRLAGTRDWTRLTMLFNSMEFETVRLYAGTWGGRAGKFWLDDWTIEEVGPLNVLRRPGTPVTVRGEDGAAYEEGRDFAPLSDPDLSVYRIDRPAPPLKLLPGGRIRDGERLRVSWYHPLLIHDSQVVVCMGEPALYDIFDHEAALLAQRLAPRSFLLNMDEVRMGGSCEACRGRDMARLLGECVARQAEILRRHSPGARVWVWSDMFDPNHNARGGYYLVEGDFTGSWRHVPKDIGMAVWGGAPREDSVRFFAEQGFPMVIACYYDAPDLAHVRGWIEAARPLANVEGFMYTTWQRKYDLLPAFGELVWGAGTGGGPR